MRQAVDDHRASNKNVPRSLYGKVVADADRELNIERIVYRALLYGWSNYPLLTKEEQYARRKEHITRKYGAGGYLKLSLELHSQVVSLNEIKEIVHDESRLSIMFDTIYEEEPDKM